VALMRRRTCVVIAAVILASAAVGCSGSSAGSADGTPTPGAAESPAALVAPSTSPSGLLLTPTVPLTQVYATKIFRPPLTVHVPPGWTTVERDPSAFQMYLGDEEYELTLDHTYTRKESVSAAIARLKKAEGLKPQASYPIVVGGRRGEAIFAGSTYGVRLMFRDSGFHTPGGDEIEVMALPLTDGSTLTIFVTKHNTRPFAPMTQLAHRILSGVTWR
jgi:hypothetical protein